MRKLLVAIFLFVAVVVQRSTNAAQAPSDPAAAGDPANGKALFTLLDCVTCHGVDAAGAWAPDLAGKGITYTQAVRAIRNPIWRMPMFLPSQLSDKEIADMVAFWASLPPSKAIAPWRRTMVSGTAPHAQQMVVNIVGCAQCHTPTVDLMRRGAGEVNGDFAWFTRMVYDHAATQAAQWKELDASAPTPPTRNRVRMGTFVSRRVPEAMLREIWDWMNDIGILVPVQVRLTADPPEGARTTYTLQVTDAAVPNKGLSAEDGTLSLIVPAGMQVVSATGRVTRASHTTRRKTRTSRPGRSRRLRRATSRPTRSPSRARPTAARCRRATSPGTNRR
jgi:mono/diheme cytochrome c family protein